MAKQGGDRDEIMSLLDNGPMTCLINDIAHLPTHVLFKFGHDLRWKSDCLFVLIHDYTKTALFLKDNTTLNDDILTFTAAWIHFSNRIEFEGFDNLLETLRAITHPSDCCHPDKQRHVCQTMDLLQQTSNTSRRATDHTFDTERLKKWHVVLMNGLMFTDNIGSFRQCGTQTTTNADGHKHSYPHHSVVSDNTTILGKLVYEMADYIDVLKRNDGGCTAEVLLMTFSLAAFAQFHFADIHPFVDGNGRMCRFLSKHILDTTCPCPFPMFTDRQVYMDSLTTARVKLLAAEEAPKALLDLLLDEAICHYRHLLLTTSIASDINVGASTGENLRKALEYFQPTLSPDVALEALSSLSPGERCTWSVGQISVRIVRLEEVVPQTDLDEL